MNQEKQRFEKYLSFSFRPLFPIRGKCRWAVDPSEILASIDHDEPEVTANLTAETILQGELW